MKGFIKKGLSCAISEKWLAAFSVLLLVIMLLPIMRLAVYAFPWYDDYMYSVHVKPYLEQYGAVKGALLGAAFVVQNKWYVWQGTYSSIFLMSLMPEIFGNGLYFIGIVMNLCFFTVSVILFVKVICTNLLKMKVTAVIPVAVLTVLMMIELIYTAQQGIFWYNSAVHYTFMHGMMLLLLSAALKVILSTSKVKGCAFVLVTVILAFVCAGANFVTCLQGLLFLFLFTVLGLLFRKKRSLWLLPAILVYGLGMYLNVSAPGNEIRSGFYQGFDPIKSVLYSFRAGILHFWEYTGIITIFILALFVLIIWNGIRGLQFAFPLPGLVTLVSFGLYCTGFTPAYYAMGGDSLSRTMVVIKFTLQLLLLLNTAYWLGWCMKKWRQRKPVPVLKQYVAAYVAFGCAAVLWLAWNPNQAGSCATYGSYYYVHTGEANNLYREYAARVETIENSEEEIVAVEAYHWKPWFLYRGDLTEDITAETNASMAEWYGKRGIYIKE